VDPTKFGRKSKSNLAADGISLADRTNGRTYTTILRLSVVVIVCNIRLCTMQYG